MYNSNELGKLSDRELLAEARLFENNLETSAASLGLTSSDHLAMKAVNDQFETQLDEWDAAQTQYGIKSAAKDDGRKSTLAKMRSKRNQIYANEDVSNAALAAVNLPPRDTVKTDSPAPSTAPFGLIEYGKLKHTIHFRDAATPDKKAKPAGMQSCEIYAYIGTTAPTSEKDFDYVGDDTNSPYINNFMMADAGKKVWFMLRWKSKSGAKGT